MSNHTPEPWKYTEHMEDGDAYGVIVGADGSVVASNQAHYPEAVTEENQRHIVACVNACVGVPREKLETTATMPRLATKSLENLERAQKAEAQLATLTAQRDELLQTLTAIANISHHGALIGKSDIYDAFNEIRRLTIKHWDSSECCRIQSGAIAKCEVKNG